MAVLHSETLVDPPSSPVQAMQGPVSPTLISMSPLKPLSRSILELRHSAYFASHACVKRVRLTLLASCIL